MTPTRVSRGWWLAAAAIGFALLVPSAASGASCGSVTAGTWHYFNITAAGMSCASAKKQIVKGGIGAHGYQRYGGWECNRIAYARTRCTKGTQSFTFSARGGGRFAASASAKARAAALGGTISLRGGRVGSLRLGRSSETQVRRVFGEPDETQDSLDDAQKPLRGLTWRCGRGCTVYVQLRGDRLALLQLYSSDGHGLDWFRTTAGTRIGEPMATAERREGQSAEPGCVTAITKKHAGRTLQIAGGQHVDQIVLYDRRAYFTC